MFSFEDLIEKKLYSVSVLSSWVIFSMLFEEQQLGVLFQLLVH